MEINEIAKRYAKELSEYIEENSLHWTDIAVGRYIQIAINEAVNEARTEKNARIAELEGQNSTQQLEIDDLDSQLDTAENLIEQACDKSLLQESRRPKKKNRPDGTRGGSDSGNSQSQSQNKES